MAQSKFTASLTTGAEHDLAGIYRRRLTQRGAGGADGADALLDGLAAALEGLADFPERGLIPPELEALGIRAFRQLSLPPYRAIYLAEAQSVTVMLAADSRRDLRILLEEQVLRSG